jgi:glycosyltransferase involved in cell wall biosynthesis
MQTISLISDSATPCGVEQFQRLLAARLAAREPGQHDTCAIVGQPGEIAVLARALRDRDGLVLGLPLVAWKRRLVPPLRAMALARRMGKAVVVVVHEWADLDWKRRTLYRAYLPAATRLLFSSPVVRAQFEADPIAGLTTRQRGLIAIPPNLAPPHTLPRTKIAETIARLRADGTRVIGTFGGIYPRKQPGALLDIVADLRQRGHAAHAVFVGDFVRAGTIDVEANFRAEVRRLGLEDAVTVTGFVASGDEVYAALGACDALVYRFDEGVTSRRASVFAALLSGRPVIVNAPGHASEFDHHQPYLRALDSGALTLVPIHATTADFTTALLAATASAAPRVSGLFDQAWDLASDAIADLPAEDKVSAYSQGAR